MVDCTYISLADSRIHNTVSARQVYLRRMFFKIYYHEAQVFSVQMKLPGSWWSSCTGIHDTNKVKYSPCTLKGKSSLSEDTSISTIMNCISSSNKFSHVKNQYSFYIVLLQGSCKSC